MDQELYERLKQEVITSRLLQRALQRLVSEEEKAPMHVPKQGVRRGD